MLHIINYANGRFMQSQKLQNKMWTSLYKSDEIRIHSFREADIRDIIHFKVESRGSGYYTWKIILIKKVLKETKDGDLIFYMDSGAYPNRKIEECVLFNINLFKAADTTYPPEKLLNRYWCKYSVLKHFSDGNYESLNKYFNAPQVYGGFQLYRVCFESKYFIDELYELNMKDSFVDDTLTKYEFPFLIEHRHDQSLLTCMAVKHQITLQKDPTQFSNDINPLTILHRGNI